MTTPLRERFANTATTTLAGSMTNVATSLTVVSATRFPTRGNFRLLIGSELLLVTAVSGTTFTVTRGVEGTTAATHSGGTAVTCLITNGSLVEYRGVMPGHYNVENYGAIPDWNGTTGTDNLAAFNACLAAMYASGNRVCKLISDGHYYLSAQLDIRQTIIWEGSGIGAQPQLVSYKTAPGTMLVFPKNVDGVHIWHDPAFGPRGDRTTIRNVSLYCSDATTTSGVGLTMHVRCELENVDIQAFGGHLLLGDTSVDGNIDSSVFKNVFLAGSTTADGCHIYGGDSNASLFAGIESSFNAGYGFFDSSFGNTYVGCTAQGNATSNYHTEQNSNRSTFIGCYCEAGPLNQMLGQCTILGGTFNGSMLTSDSTAFISSYGTASRAPLQYTNDAGATSVNARVGESGTNMYAFSWATLSGSSDADRMYMAYDATLKSWKLLNNGYYRRMINFPLASANMRQPTAWCENGIMIGRSDSANAAIIFTAESSPLSTQYSMAHLTYLRGDTVWQAQPTAAGALGQRCLTSGTRGTLNSGATTGGITNGQASLVVNTATELLVGQYIAIAGVTGTKTITAINGTTITVTPVADATVAAAAVSFVDATFETFYGLTSALGSNVMTALATFSSANIKAACTDGTGSGGALVFATSPTLTTPVINGQTQGAAVAVSAYAIDWSLGNVFTKTLGAGAQTFTFSNAASGMSITVRVTGSASTLTWPTVLWTGGVVPTQTASGKDVYTFVHDGTSIYGTVVQDMQ